MVPHNTTVLNLCHSGRCNARKRTWARGVGVVGRKKLQPATTAGTRYDRHIYIPYTTKYYIFVPAVFLLMGCNEGDGWNALGQKTIIIVGAQHTDR